MFVFYLADAKYTFNSEEGSGKNEMYFVEKLACEAGVNKRYVKVGYTKNQFDYSYQLFLS